MYKKLLNSTNRMVLAPVNNAGRAQPIQTGIYEKYILCQRCENDLLSRLERYGSIVLNGSENKNAPVYNRRITDNGEELIDISNVKYSDFKLFLLSLAWKAHISNNIFFKDVDIKQHADVIKRMLLAGDAGDDNQYQVSLLGIRAKKGDMVRIVIPPFIINSDDSLYVTFFISGFVYMVNLNGKSTPKLFENYNLKQNGTITVPVLPPELGNTFLKALGVNTEMADFFTS